MLTLSGICSGLTYTILFESQYCIVSNAYCIFYWFTIRTLLCMKLRNNKYLVVYVVCIINI